MKHFLLFLCTLAATLSATAQVVTPTSVGMNGEKWYPVFSQLCTPENSAGLVASVSGNTVNILNHRLETVRSFTAPDVSNIRMWTITTAAQSENIDVHYSQGLFNNDDRIEYVTFDGSTMKIHTEDGTVLSSIPAEDEEWEEYHEFSFGLLVFGDIERTAYILVPNGSYREWYRIDRATASLHKVDNCHIEEADIVAKQFCYNPQDGGYLVVVDEDNSTITLYNAQLQKVREISRSNTGYNENLSVTSTEHVCYGGLSQVSQTMFNSDEGMEYWKGELVFSGNQLITEEGKVLYSGNDDYGAQMLIFAGDEERRYLYGKGGSFLVDNVAGTTTRVNVPFDRCTHIAMPYCLRPQDGGYVYAKNGNYFTIYNSRLEQVKNINRGSLGDVADVYTQSTAIAAGAGETALTQSVFNADEKLELLTKSSSSFSIVQDDGTVLQTVQTGAQPDRLSLLSFNDAARTTYLICQTRGQDGNQGRFYSIDHPALSVAGVSACGGMTVSVTGGVARVEVGEGVASGTRLSVADASGRTLYTHALAPGQRTVTIATSLLARGVNIFRLGNGTVKKVRM